MYTLECLNLQKKFKNQEVLKGLTLKVPSKGVYGFLGVNGAGKTTTMKAIIGMLDLDCGEILIKGKPVSEFRNKIGYLPDVPEYYDFMNATEYLTHCANLANVHIDNLNQKINDLITLVGLTGSEKKRISKYSRGMKQRLGIAQALVNDPILLVCDEPTSALDPIGRMQILELLKKISEQTTVIFSTHILSDIDEICDYIGILSDGVLKIEGSVEEVKSKYSSNEIKIYFHENQISMAKDIITNNFNVCNLQTDETLKLISFNFNEDIKQSNSLINYLINANILISEFSIKKLSMDKIFRMVVE